MIRKVTALASVLGIVVCSAVGCSKSGSAQNEIQIPIYGAAEITYEVATAEYMDLTESKGIGATVGYPYAQNLYYPANAQVIEFNAVKGRTVEEGEVLAVLDSSDLDYEINNQQTIVDTAYSKSLYGGEIAKLNYEIEKSKLEMMLAEKESYIIRAPYKGIITQANRNKAGDKIAKNDVCCVISDESMVEIYIDGSDASKFLFGQQVIVKLDGKEYPATVTMAPNIAPATADGSAARRAVFSLGEGVMDEIYKENPIAISAGWATVYLTTEKKNVLAVPNSAIKTSGTVNSVTMVDGEERFRLPVTVGVSIGGYTEILNGISEGDVVIADGSGTFTSAAVEEDNSENDHRGEWNGEWNSEWNSEWNDDRRSDR